MAVTDGAGTVQHSNLLAGGVIGRFKPVGAVRRYYIKDHLGSVRQEVDAAGTVLTTYGEDYYPFGLQMPGRSMVSDAPKERFTGHELDDETGLYYAGARYYDPAIDQWPTPDPLADLYPGVSPYAYALNNPVNPLDPTGLSPTSTHTDSSGNVLAVYNDGDLGVYRHDDATTKAEVDAKRAETGTTSGRGTRIGRTLHEASFAAGERINLHGANFGGNLIDRYYAQASGLSLLGYALQAVDGGGLDVKVHETTGGFVSGEQGLIVSPRDVGNIVAGLVARDHGPLVPYILASYGEFNVRRSLLGGRATDAVMSVLLGTSTAALPPNVALKTQLSMFLKEDPVTISGITYGLTAVSLSLIMLFLLGCNQPYASFGEGDNAVYVCGQDGSAVVTGRPCSERSQNHLLLREGGLTGGMALYIDLCDSYSVTAFGIFDVVGDPPFEVHLLPWSTYVVQKDSLNAIYTNEGCRHVYTE